MLDFFYDLDIFMRSSWNECEELMDNKQHFHVQQPNSSFACGCVLYLSISISAALELLRMCSKRGRPNSPPATQQVWMRDWQIGLSNSGFFLFCLSNASLTVGNWGLFRRAELTYKYSLALTLCEEMHYENFYSAILSFPIYVL